MSCVKKSTFSHCGTMRVEAVISCLLALFALCQGTDQSGNQAALDVQAHDQEDPQLKARRLQKLLVEMAEDESIEPNHHVQKDASHHSHRHAKQEIFDSPLKYHETAFHEGRLQHGAELMEGGETAKMSRVEAVNKLKAAGGVKAAAKASVTIGSQADIPTMASPGQDIVSQMQGATAVSRSGRSCTDVYQKAASILNYTWDNLQAQIKSPFNESLAIAIDAIYNHEQGQPVFRKLLSALALMDMWTALQSGNLWTAIDQNDLHVLCTGLVPSGSYLEEYPATSPFAPFHSPIYQGDMAIENEPTPDLGLPPFAAALWPAPPPPPGSSIPAVGGVITYCFMKSVQMSDTNTQLAVELAIADIMSQVRCFQFVRAEPDELDQVCQSAGRPVVPSVMIRNDRPGCWSHWGQVSAVPGSQYQHFSQIINLGTGCALKGMALHQLGHTLGLGHMISRPDRDGIITFLEQTPVQIQSAYPKALWPDNSTETDLGFDMLSIMMLHSFPFDIGSDTPTAIPAKEYGLHIYLGQRMGLSQDDATRLGSLYNCDVAVQIQGATPTQNLSQQFAAGTGMFYDGSCLNVATSCLDLANFCYDPELGEQVRQGCRQTCLLCVAAPAEAIAEWEAINEARIADNHAQEAKALVNCVDEVDTGIMFADGSLADCKDLVNYCRHSTMGNKVQTVCAKTCGNCAVFGKANDRASQSIALSCQDLNETEAPVFTLRGINQACPDLVDFCSNHVDSMYIQEKCPSTCGICNGGKAVRPTPEPNVYWAPGGEEVEQGIAPAPGSCDRRRRWGFCWSRRRRSDGIDPADP